MIANYIVEENIFVVIVYKLSEQQIYWLVSLKAALKLVINKGLRCLQKVNMFDSKIMRKNKVTILIYADFESIIVLKDNEKQTPNDFFTNKC